MKNIDKEDILIKERYKNREQNSQYSILKPEIFKMHQERLWHEMTMLSSYFGTKDFSNLNLTDMGSGYGFNILEFLRMGFMPCNISAIELLKDRFDKLKKIIPNDVNLYNLNAINAPIANSSQDIVFQSAVFTSILDEKYKQTLAKNMWDWTKPGGCILYYDFIYNNPKNKEVKGVSIKEIKELFPDGNLKYKKKVTLAMPISRKVCSIHPSVYNVLNIFPFLRTHVLCIIEKK